MRSLQAKAADLVNRRDSKSPGPHRRAALDAEAAAAEAAEVNRPKGGVSVTGSSSVYKSRIRIRMKPEESRAVKVRSRTCPNSYVCINFFVCLWP